MELAVNKNTNMIWIWWQTYECKILPYLSECTITLHPPFTIFNFQANSYAEHV